MRDESPNIYAIPKNFIESGYMFGGRVRTKNFIEGCILDAPIIGGYIYGIKMLHWSVTNTIAVFAIVAGGIMLAAINGIKGDSFLEYISNAIKFSKNKHFCRYNDRIKMEITPDYLTGNRDELPREKLIRLLNKIRSGANADSAISSDITDERIKVWFTDDADFVEKPDALKSREELKADKKARKKAEKERKQLQRAALKAMSPKQRKAAKKLFLQEKAKRKEEEKRIAEAKAAEMNRIIEDAIKTAQAGKRLYLKEQNKN